MEDKVRKNKTNQGGGWGVRDGMSRTGMDGWMDGGDSKNELVLFSFCERQFSTLTSYRRTTWVDNMNANKIRKKKH